jgi:hypothetical protein
MEESVGEKNKFLLFNSWRGEILLVFKNFYKVFLALRVIVRNTTPQNLKETEKRVQNRVQFKKNKVSFRDLLHVTNGISQ